MPFSILILPLGDIESEILAHVKTTLDDTFHAKATILPPIEAPLFALSTFRRQFSAPAIVRRIGATFPRDDAKVLGITKLDLFAPRTNFVFGEAQINGPAAVISLYRLLDGNRGLYLERVGKEAVHEIGHTFGLKHCQDRHCVMRFSHNLGDTDAKPALFCEKDREVIDKSLNYEGIPEKKTRSKRNKPKSV